VAPSSKCLPRKGRHGAFAGNAVWSMPDRFEVYIVYKRRYINTLHFLFFFIYACVCVLLDKFMYFLFPGVPQVPGFHRGAWLPGYAEPEDAGKDWPTWSKRSVTDCCLLNTSLQLFCLPFVSSEYIYFGLWASVVPGFVFLHHPTMSAKALCFGLSICRVRLSGQILWPWYLMNGLSNLD